MSLRRFKVRSRSQPDTEHDLVVNRDGKVLSCTCPGFGYRGQCYHAARLMQFLEEFTEWGRTE